MTLPDYLNDLNKGRKPEQFVLISTGNTSIAEEIQKLTQSALEKEFSDPETISLHGYDASEEDLHANLVTPPIFQPARLVFLRHADIMLKRIDQNQTVAAYFQRDLTSLPNNIFAIFQLDESKIPASMTFLKKSALFLEEENLKEKDQPAYLLQRVSAAGFTTTLEVMRLLCEKCAFDINQATRALDRVIVFCLHTRSITSDDVEEILFDMEGDLNFKIIDAIADRDIDTAMKQILQHRFSDGIQVSSGWIRLFTDAWRYAAMKSAGIINADIQKILHMKKGQMFFFTKHAERISTRYTEKELRGILKQLPDLDRRIKSENGTDAHLTILLMFLESLRKTAKKPAGVQ